MKRASALFMILLPATLLAQQPDFTLGSKRPGPVSTLLTDAALTDINPDKSGATDRLVAATAQTSDVPAPKKSKPKQKPKAPPNPPIEGSMVGYIDDAIVGSQIRIRFDAGFNDNVPDRAEFFYPQCGCDGINGGPNGNTKDPGAPGPAPGSSNDINFQQLYFQLEYAPIHRLSIFTEVPFRWIQPQSFIPNTYGSTTFSGHGGISDVRAGFKLGLVAASTQALTFQFRAYFPSGNSFRGLGTNHYSVEPALLYYQKLSTHWTVEAQFGDWIPIGGSTLTTDPSKGYAGNILFYGIGPSYKLVNGDHIQVAPVVELVGWSVLGGLQTLAAVPNIPPGPPVSNADAAGTNIVNLKIGARITVGMHNSIYVGYGHSLTSARWYDDIARVEYRFSF